MLHSAVDTHDATRTSRRLTWMDLLRGTAVLLVMLNHAIGMAHVDGWPMPEWLMAATRSVEPFRLPLLLLISGLFLPRALTKPVTTYVSGKLRNVAWPLALWAPLTVFTHVPERLGDPSAYVGPSHLWYLLTLLFCYAVGLLAHRIGVGRRFLPAWSVAAALLAMLFLWLPTQVNFLWFGAFFFVGAWLVPHVRRIQNAHWGLFAALAGVAAVGSYLHLEGLMQGQSLLGFGLALAGCGAMLWLAPRIPRARPVRWLEAIGRHSIVYYVVHLPVIAALYNVIQPMGVPTLQAIAAGVVLSFVVSSLVTRFPMHEVLFSFPSPRRGLAASLTPTPAPAKQIAGAAPSTPA